jgi:hypothetical protein
MRFAIAAALLAAPLALPALAGGVTNELMLSSAWCTFTYNKTTGYSNTKRVAFAPNGAWFSGARGEGGSSGANGSVYSQRDSRAGGAWKVQRGELYMSEGGAPLEPVQTLVKRNSNGYPIIVADGVEYSQCR